MEPFDLEPEPEPQPAGGLEPPRRRPPTAVGIGKLPPDRPPQEPADAESVPADDGTPYCEGPTMVRRVALRLLAADALAATALLLWPLGWRAYAGVVVLTIADVSWHRAKRRESPAPASGFSTERQPPGESHLRSA